MTIEVGGGGSSLTTLRGSTTFTATSFDVTIPDIGDVTKAQTRYLGMQSSSTSNSIRQGPLVELINSTTLRLRQSDGVNRTVSWEVSYEA